MWRLGRRGVPSVTDSVRAASLGCPRVAVCEQEITPTAPGRVGTSRFDEAVGGVGR